MCDPRRISTPISSLLSTKGGRLSLVFLGYFVPLKGTISPSSASNTFLFFFKSGLGSNPTVVIGGGGGRGRFVGTWMSGMSFKENSLFLLAIRPFRPGLFFRSMFSSSLELVSSRATINLRWGTVENLLDSVPESESSTGLSGAPSPSSKWN